MEAPDREFEEKILQLDQLFTGFRRQLRRYSKKVLAADLDLRLPHFILLRLLKTNGPMKASDLASWMAVTRGAISNLMDHLEGKGLIHRQRSDRDKRVVEVSVTAEGEATLERIDRRRIHYLRLIFRELPEEDLNQLIETYRQLHHRIEELGDPDELLRRELERSENSDRPEPEPSAEEQTIAAKATRD